MQIINMLFLKTAEMSLTAGIVICVVLLVRLLVRELPKKFAYILWIVVAFRLIVPVSAHADISIFHLFPVRFVSSELSGIVQGSTSRIKDVVDRSGVDDEKQAGGMRGRNVQSTVQTASTDGDVNAKNTEGTGMYMYGNQAESDSGMSAPHSDSVTFLTDTANEKMIDAMACTWIAGILTLVSYTVAVYGQLRRQIRYSICLGGNVYACDRIRSPFVLGLCTPRIYLPFRLSDTERQCVLAHERYHIRRKDYLIKGFAYVLVIVYWFQPLVWAAYHFMCIDMEMSCDEKIISGFTVEMRKEYSRLLLAFASNKRQLPANPPAFGEENTMKRIQNILHYKKAARWRLAGGAVLIMITMAACATDAVPVADNTIGINNIPETGNADSNEKNDTVFGMMSDTDAIGHQPAQWAENTMFDMELCSLDYADSEKIVFHVSFGLFAYDLQKQHIVRSVDLKALNCQAVQTGGLCKVEVYLNGDKALKAVIKPYPYSVDGGYIYDMESDRLYAYDAALLDNYTLFDGFVSKYDLQDEKVLDTWRIAENVLPLEEQSYAALYWGQIELVTMYYKAGEQTYQLFHKEEATLPKQQKQDESFYQSFAQVSGRDVRQCLLDYQAFYDRHDYAGVCALSKGLEYSDEMQREFAGRSDRLSVGREVRHSEDEKEYVFEFSRGDDSGVESEKVYLKFQYIEGEGWRAAGLPTTEN